MPTTDTSSSPPATIPFSQSVSEVARSAILIFTHNCAREGAFYSPVVEASWRCIIIVLPPSVQHPSTPSPTPRNVHVLMSSVDATNEALALTRLTGKRMRFDTITAPA